jgi:hypothetical protein
VTPPPPALVTLHLWGVPTRRVPAALVRMARDRSVRRAPGLTFAKLLGTGAGRTFTPLDADPHHWGLLAAWTSAGAADGFAASSVTRGWADISDEILQVRMVPLAARGRWSGREPFGDPRPARWDGAVAAITRARLRWPTMGRFLAASPPVAAALAGSPGLVLATGIGEAPVSVQGTFSLWRSAADLSTFAYRRAEHVAVVRRTPQERWYAEELFARFAVQSAAGRFAGRDVTIPAGLARDEAAPG